MYDNSDDEGEGNEEDGAPTTKKRKATIEM